MQQYLDPILKKIRDTINVRNKKGDTPLITAIRNENESLAKYLVERGANIDKRGENDNTPVLVAVEEHNKILTKYLVERGAHIHVPNCFGRTAQTVTEDSEYNAIIEILQNAEEE